MLLGLPAKPRLIGCPGNGSALWELLHPHRKTGLRSQATGSQAKGTLAYTTYS